MEEWKVVVGSDGRYEVSNLGNVRNAETKRILKPQYKHGYTNVSLRLNKFTTNKKYLIHRLVAMAFIPNPENKPEVNHKDGVHDNNCADNLEWVTPGENVRHSIENGLQEAGVRYKLLHGVGQYDDSHKHETYLRDTELISKEEYESLLGVSDFFGVSVGKLASLIAETLCSGRFRLDADGKSIVATSAYIDAMKQSVAEPYVDKISTLESEIHRLKAKNEGRNASPIVICKQYVGLNGEQYDIGSKRNHLEIIGFAKNKFGHTELVCRCDCGNIKLENPAFWLNDKVKSCGCMREDLLSEALKRDDSRRSEWLFTLWQRRHRKADWCDEWSDFDSFYEWSYNNGYRHGMHLYRNNPMEPFSPNNCKWVDTDKPQAVRIPKGPERFPVNGEVLSIIEASNKYGLIEQTVRYRMKRGMTLEEAVNTPLNANGRKPKTA